MQRIYIYKAAPKLKGLKAFGQDLVRLVQNIRLRRRIEPVFVNIKYEVDTIEEYNYGKPPF